MKTTIMNYGLVLWTLIPTSILVVVIIALVVGCRRFPRLREFLNGKISYYVGVAFALLPIGFGDSGHWTKVLAGLVLVALLMGGYEYCQKLKERLHEAMSGYVGGIVVLIATIIALLLIPFVVHCPVQLANLLHESIDTTKTERRELPMQGEKDRQESRREIVTTEQNVHSRAPAVFVLIFVCALYTSLLGILFRVLTKMCKEHKREKLLKESLENIVKIIGKLDDEEMVKAYQKKMLDKYLGVWLEDQED